MIYQWAIRYGLNRPMSDINLNGVKADKNVVNDMQRHKLDLRRVVSLDVGDREGGSSDSRCETGIEVANDDESISDNVGSPTTSVLKSLPRRNPASVRVTLYIHVNTIFF